MDNVAQFALVALTSLRFIVDPIAVVPAYLVITRDETAGEQRRTAKRACIAMTLLLIFFAATGNLLFRAFAITLPAFRTAGGLILWYVAIDMLRASGAPKRGRKKCSRARPRKTWRSRLWRFRCSPDQERFPQSSYFPQKHGPARAGGRLRLGGGDRAGFVFRVAPW
jgi:hypothetical protein